MTGLRTELVTGTLTLPGAAIGPVSPLPLVAPLATVGEIAPEVRADVAARARVGAPPSLFPYHAQDGYGRALAPVELDTVVLDNGLLRATFLPGLGGRLWSLYDAVAGRELLYVNPVLQPANLALRNAWFSGGVEFNVGTRGHSPTTMAPLFAARVVGPDGGEGLRMWEYERVRGVVVQLDVWLPVGVAALAIHVRIANPGSGAVPMYWWTNAAVVSRDDVRVLAPATQAFRTDYPDGVRVCAVPFEQDGGVDTSYPTRHPHAVDYFYDIAEGQQPWVAAVGGDGRGVLHTSTPELTGRKLFVWGERAGGQRWQEWLSHGGDQRYAEIQAGLVPTQFEHTSLDGGATLSWTELFAPLALDPTAAHGEWDAAVAAVDAVVARDHAAARLAEWQAQLAAAAAAPPVELLGHGSGWGALERRRLLVAGEDWPFDRATPFDDAALGVEQQRWSALLDGAWSSAAPIEPPHSHVAGPAWDALLAAVGDAVAGAAALVGDDPGVGAAEDTAVTNRSGMGAAVDDGAWLAAYHRGALAHGAAEFADARRHYEASLALAESAWAHRGLAQLARLAATSTATAGDRHRADWEAAVEHARRAAELAPEVWQLWAEAATVALEADRPAEAVGLLDGVAGLVGAHPRLLVLRLWGLALTGDHAQVAAAFDAGFEVPDLREGELSLGALWELVRPGEPVPPRYDFRMH